MTTFVMGIPYLPDGSALLFKPASEKHRFKGLLNGFGGEVNQGEGFRAAVSRETLEEGKFLIDVDRWFGFEYQRWINGDEVYYFAAYMNYDETREISFNPNDEGEVRRLSWKNYIADALTMRELYAPGLSWLLPMGWDHLTRDQADRSIA